MQIDIDELERVLLRSIIERKETCRQAAEHVMTYIQSLEATDPPELSPNEKSPAALRPPGF